MTQHQGHTTPASKRSVRVLHLTDLHLFADDASELRGTNTDQSLRRVLEHVSDSDWIADTTLVTGDLIQDDTRAAYERCRDKLGHLPAPIVVCPGNHDLPELMNTVFDADPFRLCGHMDTGNWRIVTLSTWVEGSASGRLSDAALDALGAAVRTDRHVLVALHHPTRDLGSRWLDALQLANRDSFEKIIKSVPSVRCVLFGHAHQAYDDTSDAVRYLCTPSTCRQFLPGSDVFAVDEQPPAYRRLELNEDGSIATSVVWVNDD
ncbi:MAG: metallophosphoesterase [Pseudomonadota bacterium]